MGVRGGRGVFNRGNVHNGLAPGRIAWGDERVSYMGIFRVYERVHGLMYT